MKQETKQLTMKKATLTAWAKILYKEGIIDLSRCTRMISAIDRLKEPAPDLAGPAEGEIPDEGNDLQIAG